MAALRSIKLTLLLAVLAVAGTAGESGEPRTNHIRSRVQVNGVDVGTTTTSYAQPKSLVSAAEEFIDFEVELLRRRLQAQDVTRCNTWCKLKQSLGMTIIGLLLICIAPCLMWKNEGRHVNELRRIDFCKNKAVVIDNSDVLTDEHTGDLVHFVGKVSVDDDALDLKSGALNISSPLTKALIIKRTCSIYQKFEQSTQQTKNDRIGAGQTTTTTFNIEEKWSPMGPAGPLEHFPNDSNSSGIWDELVSAAGVSETVGPAHPKLPTNLPPQMAALLQQVDSNQPPHSISISKSAHVGGFGLSSDIVMTEKAVFQANWIQVPAELVPDHIASLPELRKDRYGSLTTVEEGDQPTNGDVMIKYEYVADGFDASFIVQQVVLDADPEAGVPDHKFGVDKQKILDEKCCGKITDDLGVIWMVRAGRHDLKEMITMAKEDEKALTKVLRILCWILLVAGWMMLFSIFTTLLSTLPLLGALGGAAFFIVALIVGTVCCCAVTALAYFRYRPLLTSIILAIAGGIAGIVIWKLNDAGNASYAPTQSPVPAPKFLMQPEQLVLEYY